MAGLGHQFLLHERYKVFCNCVVSLLLGSQNNQNTFSELSFALFAGFRVVLNMEELGKKGLTNLVLRRSLVGYFYKILFR
jgi:hypothetical protein